MASDKRYAVLIDADNISDRYIKFILDEISNYGIANYKRIYGDWTKPALASWKATLLEHSITPIQQYSYTVGKNATDSSMIIDAMDILYAGRVDGFCLVSSDSDFTRLAARLREAGMEVVGMGERKTPKPFIASCSQFKYLDVIAAANSPAKPVQPPQAAKKKDAAEPSKEASELDKIKSSILTIVSENSDEDDWIFIGTIGNLLVKRHPDFDVRNFGFKKLTPFIESLNLFAMKSIHTGDGNVKLIYVKKK